jgi:hypothetical protein
MSPELLDKIANRMPNAISIMGLLRKLTEG